MKEIYFPSSPLAQTFVSSPAAVHVTHRSSVIGQRQRGDVQTPPPHHHRISAESAAIHPTESFWGELSSQS